MVTTRRTPTRRRGAAEEHINEEGARVVAQAARTRQTAALESQRKQAKTTDSNGQGSSSSEVGGKATSRPKKAEDDGKKVSGDEDGVQGQGDKAGHAADGKSLAQRRHSRLQIYQNQAPIGKYTVDIASAEVEEEQEPPSATTKKAGKRSLEAPEGAKGARTKKAANSEADDRHSKRSNVDVSRRRRPSRGNNPHAFITTRNRDSLDFDHDEDEDFLKDHHIGRDTDFGVSFGQSMGINSTGFLENNNHGEVDNNVNSGFKSIASTLNDMKTRFLSSPTAIRFLSRGSEDGSAKQSLTGSPQPNNTKIESNPNSASKPAPSILNLSAFKSPFLMKFSPFKQTTVDEDIPKSQNEDKITDSPTKENVESSTKNAETKEDEENANDNSIESAVDEDALQSNNLDENTYNKNDTSISSGTSSTLTDARSDEETLRAGNNKSTDQEPHGPVHLHISPSNGSKGGKTITELMAEAAAETQPQPQIPSSTNGYRTLLENLSQVQDAVDKINRQTTNANMSDDIFDSNPTGWVQNIRPSEDSTSQTKQSNTTFSALSNITVRPRNMNYTIESSDQPSTVTPKSKRRVSFSLNQPDLNNEEGNDMKLDLKMESSGDMESKDIIHTKLEMEDQDLSISRAETSFSGGNSAVKTGITLSTENSESKSIQDSSNDQQSELEAILVSTHGTPYADRNKVLSLSSPSISITGDDKQLSPSNNLELDLEQVHQGLLNAMEEKQQRQPEEPTISSSVSMPLGVRTADGDGIDLSRMNDSVGSISTVERDEEQEESIVTTGEKNSTSFSLDGVIVEDTETKADVVEEKDDRIPSAETKVEPNNSIFVGDNDFSAETENTESTNDEDFEFEDIRGHVPLTPSRAAKNKEKEDLQPQKNGKETQEDTEITTKSPSLEKEKQHPNAESSTTNSPSKNQIARPVNGGWNNRGTSNVFSRRALGSKKNASTDVKNQSSGPIQAPSLQAGGYKVNDAMSAALESFLMFCEPVKESSLACNKEESHKETVKSDEETKSSKKKRIRTLFDSPEDKKTTEQQPMRESETMTELTDQKNIGLGTQKNTPTKSTTDAETVEQASPQMRESSAPLPLSPHNSNNSMNRRSASTPGSASRIRQEYSRSIPKTRSPLSKNSMHIDDFIMVGMTDIENVQPVDIEGNKYVSPSKLGMVEKNKPFGSPVKFDLTSMFDMGESKQENEGEHDQPQKSININEEDYDDDDFNVSLLLGDDESTQGKHLTTNEIQQANEVPSGSPSKLLDILRNHKDESQEVKSSSNDNNFISRKEHGRSNNEFDFGLGSFENVFITEADLETARAKMGAQETDGYISREQLISNACDNAKSFLIDPSNPAKVKEIEGSGCNNSHSGVLSMPYSIMCINNIPLGECAVSVHAQGVVCIGEFNESLNSFTNKEFQIIFGFEGLLNPRFIAFDTVKMHAIEFSITRSDSTSPITIKLQFPDEVDSATIPNEYLYFASRCSSLFNGCSPKGETLKEFRGIIEPSTQTATRFERMQQLDKVRKVTELIRKSCISQRSELNTVNTMDVEEDNETGIDQVSAMSSEQNDSSITMDTFFKNLIHGSDNTSELIRIMIHEQQEQILAIKKYTRMNVLKTILDDHSDIIEPIIGFEGIQKLLDYSSESYGSTEDDDLIEVDLNRDTGKIVLCINPKFFEVLDMNNMDKVEIEIDFDDDEGGHMAPPVKANKTPNKDKSISSNTATATATECQLCFANSVTEVIQPCGHKLCKPCAKKLTQDYSECPWDRMEIESISKLK